MVAEPFCFNDVHAGPTHEGLEVWALWDPDRVGHAKGKEELGVSLQCVCNCPAVDTWVPHEIRCVEKYPSHGSRAAATACSASCVDGLWCRCGERDVASNHRKLPRLERTGEFFAWYKLHSCQESTV
jgi:hypothetical protein